MAVFQWCSMVMSHHNAVTRLARCWAYPLGATPTTVTAFAAPTRRFVTMPQLRSALLLTVIALLSIVLGPAPCHAQVRVITDRCQAKKRFDFVLRV
jgi:hypothetical protein